MTHYKGALIALLALTTLGACAPQSVRVTATPLRPNEVVGVDVGVAGKGIAGQEITVAVIQERDPHTNQVHRSVARFNNPNTGGELTKIGVGAVIPTAMNNLTALAIAGMEEPCESCGNISIGVEGSQALAGAQSGSISQAESTAKAKTQTAKPPKPHYGHGD